MPSLDIVSKVDQQALDNAINNLKREILNRYDFRGSNTVIELNRDTFSIEVVSESEMKVQQIEASLISKVLKQKIDPACIETTAEAVASGNQIRKNYAVKNGLSKEDAKKIVKLIKGTKLKVQPQIMDDQVRVSGKKIDDLQSVMNHLKGQSLGFPLQFVNMKR